MMRRDKPGGSLSAIELQNTAEDRSMSVNWPYEFPGVYWLDGQEDTAAQDVLRNGSLFRYYGLNAPKYVDAFEDAARRYYGARHALAVNSGTGALMAAMSALDIGPGCEVILPAFLWVATVAAVIHQNAIPVLCEVDESLCMDPADLQRKITPRTKLIVPIHMAGTPCDMDGIMAVANRHEIPVLEDCAQCNGGTYRGRALGTIGRMGIFSLQLNKNMTCGEGGLLVTDDQRLYYRAFSAHDMGMIRVGGRLAMPEPYAVAWGAGRRMTELCGAVASVQIKKLDQILASMRASKRRIEAQLEDVPGLSFRRMNDAEGDCGAFLIMLMETEAHAASVVGRMKAAGLHNAFHISEYGLHIYSNIPALVNRVPLSPAGNPWSLSENAQSMYSYAKGTCPVSDALFARSVLLPIPSQLTMEQENAAAQAIRQAVAESP
jgi:8-amino-3,8-dideoxy-alpha-D-manno-octulosonate transaminase